MFDNCFFFYDIYKYNTKPFTMKTNFYWILLFLLLGSKMSFGQNPLWLFDNRFYDGIQTYNLPKPTTVYGQAGTTNSGTATNPNPYDGYDG